MRKLIRATQRFLRDEEGASAVEYGVLVALIIVAVITIIYSIGQELKTGFEKVRDCLKTPSSCV